MFSSNRRVVRAKHAQRSVTRARSRLFVEILEDRQTPSVSFLGVGAGDATSSDAILWTRAKNSSTAGGVGVHAEVSTDETFASDLATFSGITDPAHDYTIHVDATGLDSGTRYFYRFVANDNTISPVGTFVTAPDPAAPVPARFGFTGDADGLMRPYPATASADFAPPGTPDFGGQAFDYFVWLGDTMYETASGQGTPNFSPAVSNTPTLSDYWAKYRQQLQPVFTGPYAGLQNFFDSTGHYTLLDNHETGNREFQSGGAPAGAPFNTTNPAFDVNTTGTYMNQTAGFQVLEQAYTDYQPIRQQVVSAPDDPRSDGTQQLYFAQQWGANSIFFNLDDRSYRDIRLRTGPTGGSDDNGVRADNSGRTMLGATQLQWFEQSLLAAQEQGIVWKIVAISSPIDQIGPIGGSFTLTNGPDNGPGTYSTTVSDGGKSWMGGYRAERNAMLKFIADNQIDHVIFLTTDDHQLRINELGYFTQFDASGMPIQSSYTRVPGVMQILDGPIGATGPDLITDHSFANIQTLAHNYATQQMMRGIDPIGLDPAFPGLTNVWREGDPTAATDPKPFDFYSPDTFNYAVFDLSADGSTLTVTVKGIDSYASNTFPQPGAANVVRQILQFQIALEPAMVAVRGATATAGQTTTLAATLTDANDAPLANRTLTFSLNGDVVGTATTDDNGEAVLADVSVSGIPGHFSDAVTVRFAGDAADLPGSGSAALDILPARDVTRQVRVHREIEDGPPGTSIVEVEITNRRNSETLTGLFAIQLNNLTPGVALESATITIHGQAYDLTITYDVDGNPIINIPASIASSLRPGQSLPRIELVFDNPDDAPIHFQTQVFLDPLDS
jgi:phosphodiesterase/alkaline phosphatase D-like protein